MHYYNEIEPFCCSILKSQIDNGRLPKGYVDQRDIRNVGVDELREYKQLHLFAGIGGFAAGFNQALFPDDISICTAGFPCQDLSVAGKRAGLAGARSGLFWEVVRILGELRTPWFVLENVPGLFSSNDGRDFAVILESLDELGYGLAWRVLDSQYFGVAQRRRRVFIVGCLGKPCPAEILFESTGGSGDFAEGGEERADLAVPLTRGSGVTSNAPGRRREDDFNLAIASSGERARAITGSCWKRHDEDTDTLVATALSASAGHHGHSSPSGDGSDNLVATLNSGGNDGGFRTEPGEHLVATTYAFGAPTNAHGMRNAPGLPLGLDSARYRALGNAVTVSVAEFIGRRIIEAEKLSL